MNTGFKIILLGMLLLIGRNSHSETSDDRLRWVADLVEFDTINGKKVRRFTGNVRLRQGNAKLACEKAVWYDDEGRGILEKNVEIDDGEKILTADFVIYDDRLRQEEARGHVKIVDSLRTLLAEHVVFFEVENMAIADKNVRIIDHDHQVILTGGHAEYFRANDSVFITFEPVLIQQDSLGNETVRVTGKVMELAQNGAVALVSDSVRITKDSTEARCGIAEFLRESEKIILRVQPEVWQSGQRLKGDSIELYLDENRIRQVLVLNQATIYSKADSIDTTRRWNLLSGQKMTIDFKESEMEKILVENQATSWYHVIEKKKYKGLNKVTGDKLTLEVKDRKLHRIQIESQPGLSSGVFYPPEQTMPAEMPQLNELRQGVDDL
jgi:lipopolysaccharide export system protein LptA